MLAKSMLFRSTAAAKFSTRSCVRAAHAAPAKPVESLLQVLQKRFPAQDAKVTSHRLEQLKKNHSTAHLFSHFYHPLL